MKIKPDQQQITITEFALHRKYIVMATTVRRYKPDDAKETCRIYREATRIINGDIGCFYCDPEIQRKGTGRQLYRAIERHAVNMGLTELNAGVSVDAMPFFKAMGFEIIKINQNVICGSIAIHNIMKKSIVNNKLILSAIISL